MLSGTTVLALAGLSSIYGLRIPFIYAVTLMLSIISAFFDTTIVSSIPSLVTNKSLMKINSYSSAVDSISSIGGPLLGGFIFGMVPMNIFLIVNGLSFIASAISEMFMDFKFNKSEPAEEGVRERFSFMSVIKDTREVMGFIKGQKLLYAILRGSFIVNFFIGAAISVVNPYIVNNIIGMSSTQFGIIEATFSIAFLVTSIVIGKLPERQKMMKRLTTCVLLDGLLLGAMGIPALGLKSLVGVNVLFVYYIIVVFIFSVSIVLVNVPLMVYLQRMTPGHILGRVVGVIHTFSGAIGPAGGVIAGALVEIVPAYAMTFISGASVAMVAAGLIRNKALRDL
jgi:MFS family permease